MNAVQHPIPPVVDSDSCILILGSFPSVQSRADGFYYAHPRNRFWQMLAGVYGEETPMTIPGRQALLHRHGIALWDVIAACEITGSSDASIRHAQPVDIARVMDVAPIRCVICNGNLAARLYHQHLEQQVGLPALTAPSTSPANAAWQLPQLITRWRELLRPTGN